MKSNKKKKKSASTSQKQKFRFMAMSKLIGLIIGIALCLIIAYTMYEMHIQRDLSSLPQLIISVFAIGSVYVGFYLTMAKWEHLETEKTTREKELLKLKKQLGLYNCQEQLEEDIQECETEIEKLKNKKEYLEEQEIDTNNY